MEPTLEGAMALARSATGPLSPHLPAFVTSLIDQRYAVVCVRAKAWRATAFDAWLATQGVELADVQDVHVDEFIRRPYRPRSDCQAPPRRHEPNAVRQLLGYLRGQGLCAAAPVVIVPADVLVASFAQYLRRERGLATATIGYYRTITRDFLVHRFGSECIALGALHATDIIGFVQHQARRLSARGLKHVVTALRAFLRFAQYRGEIDEALISAVPAVAAWSTTPPLPRAISAEHARRVIESCDLSTVVGRRDRAVLLLLARLGLRGGEVITLLLEDIDWDAGRLCVRGKNGHQCLMPLPVDVGEAIAAYLQNGRPACADRHLFLRSRAPLRGLMHGSDGVGSIVGNALRRAGVDAPHKGSHQFRHALAVRMLQGGASLPEIGEVLRHRSPLSTSIYAKVDLAALRPLALPWPGSSS
ncbi:putative integrase/recombinase y4rA [Thiomonas sp. X19]|uniref:site-specific integrase n=1 Tax=Thiomonas sp. X19 TaxID=1050370 RepID=UPI000B6C7DCB|nr:site-specific integrase [Thiomonas sp. X19]SCC93372.1 putative integrase/recombinase y4rA [Thiomonas sp. X19]